MSDGLRGRGMAAETVAWFAFGGEREDWQVPFALLPVLWLRLHGDLRNCCYG